MKKMRGSSRLGVFFVLMLLGIVFLGSLLAWDSRPSVRAEKMAEAKAGEEGGSNLELASMWKQLGAAQASTDCYVAIISKHHGNMTKLANASQSDWDLVSFSKNDHHTVSTAFFKKRSCK